MTSSSSRSTARVASAIAAAVLRPSGSTTTDPPGAWRGRARSGGRATTDVALVRQLRPPRRATVRSSSVSPVGRSGRNGLGRAGRAERTEPGAAAAGHDHDVHAAPILVACRAASGASFGPPAVGALPAAAVVPTRRRGRRGRSGRRLPALIAARIPEAGLGLVEVRPTMVYSASEM